MKIIVGLILFLFTVMFNSGNLSQQDGAPVSIGVYKILPSKVLGEKRTLLIHLPRNYQQDKNKKYPVFYMLYGDHRSTYFAEAVSVLDNLGINGTIPEMILVGITNTHRYRDLLPRGTGGEETGIENFIRFFREELFPWVQKHYRTHPYRLLLGPQAGANFLFYTVFKHPDLFNAGIGTNPFRWTGGREQIIQQAKAVLKKQKKFKKMLYFNCNDNDQLERQGTGYMKNFVEFLKAHKPKGFQFTVNYITDWREFLAPLDLRRGLKTLFSNYEYTGDLAKSNLSSIQQFYLERSREYGYPVDIPELTLVLAHDRLERIDPAAAGEILNFILKQNPDSSNGLFRKSNLLDAEGRLDEAIACLERMVKVFKSSDNGGIIRRIESLKRKKVYSAAYLLQSRIGQKGLEGTNDFIAGIEKNKNIYFSERELNSLGYWLLGRKQARESEYVFRLNLRKFPQSSNVYDSLGELLMHLKRYREAIKCYKKALKLNPQNDHAKKMLNTINKILG